MVAHGQSFMKPWWKLWNGKNIVPLALALEVYLSPAASAAAVAAVFELQTTAATATAATSSNEEPAQANRPSLVHRME